MSQTSVAPTANVRTSVQVLVVDDTPTNLFILAKLLGQEGYEVLQAQTGEVALDLARQHHPALILLDIMMPGMDGYQVCQALRADEATGQIPVIFLSALDDTFDKVKAFEQGATDYITKPFHAEEVLARVRNQVNAQLAYQQQQRLNLELENRVQERTQLLESAHNQLETAHNQLLDVALTDRLTRLPNRLSFVKQLSKVMAQSQLEYDANFAVLFLDCDRFKRVNDSLGHRVGDQLLKGVAQRLSQISSDHATINTVARFGGDEFALLLTDVRGRAAVVAVAEEILHGLSSSFPIAGRDIFINASIGMVWGDRQYVAAEHLLRDVDLAMYRAKECHRSKYCWFESSMRSRAVHLLQLETDLRLALERRELELYYQPIMDLKQMKVVGFEALVRWQHPTRGLIGPNEFIPFAEETGFIVQLGAQVLEMACAHIADWEAAGLLSPEMSISVNIAGAQLLQPDIMAQISRTVEAAGIAPNRLRLELTEHSIIHNHTCVDDVLKALQKRRILVSIDDFGTGYSSLSYLHTLPVNCLKVDRAFVQPITASADSLGIVPLIVNIAKTMNMQVVAEGIETLTQLMQMQALGCEYGQGFLFQKALPADEAIALLSRPLDHWLSRFDAQGEGLPSKWAKVTA